MTGPVNPNLRSTMSPPVMEARRWIDGKRFPPDRALINVSQAAPVAPPPEPMRRAIADIVLNDTEAHLYGPVLGLPNLRDTIAEKWSIGYDGKITGDQVAITSGCNQAFTAAISSLAGPGDEVILPTPWYFNHKMHLDMSGVITVPAGTGDTLLPGVENIKALITSRTRAIVLVSPNNPGGVEYPASLLREFYELAKSNGIALIVDETYRDFDSRTGAPHDLFADFDWHDTLIQLYSFSKAYRLTGHRVGAIVASQARLAECEKYLDTVTICPNQIAQRAALWGMDNLDSWLAGERREILARRAALQAGFDRLPGWRALGIGAYFAYVRHPYDIPSDQLAPLLVEKAGILMLPGTMFKPVGDESAKQEMRIAFANIDTAGIEQLILRLENLAL